MDQRDWEIFRELSRTLHFGKTSRLCSLSPSALSRLVQRLEYEVGEPLLLRDKRHVELTAAGRALRDYAEESLDRWGDFRQRLANEAETVTGEISLYASVTACYSVLPSLLNRFRGRYPGVRINLETGDASGGLGRIRDQQVDVTVIAQPEKLPERVAFLPLVETPLCFIGPASPCKVTTLLEGWPERIDWEQLPVVLSRGGLARDRLDAWFRENDIVPRVYAQVSGSEAISAMVGSGCGIGVIPELVLRKSSFENLLRVLPVSEGLAPYSVGLAAMENRLGNRTIAAFWECAAEGLDPV